MKISFSGQAQDVVRMTNAWSPAEAPEQAYFDETAAIIEEARESSTAKRFWLNEWIEA